MKFSTQERNHSSANFVIRSLLGRIQSGYMWQSVMVPIGCQILNRNNILLYTLLVLDFKTMAKLPTGHQIQKKGRSPQFLSYIPLKDMKDNPCYELDGRL
jgi:hypothetical protein